jgi:putative membrane-bound dehydrogenase-like protein
MIGKALAATLLVALVGTEPDEAALAEGRERIEVLFLGDRGHHQPEARCDQVAGQLARLGIDLWFRADAEALSPEKLALVDVLLVYANHDAIAPEQEKALLEFVERGGGLVAVHCASYCFRNSEKYVALVGGQFDHHGMGELTARTVAADHPALRGVAEFATVDETYVHRALAADRTLLQVRDDGDAQEPYTWTREQGKGRVYYTALGHDARTWGQPAFVAQLAQAIRWAGGRPGFEFAPPKTEEEQALLPNYAPGERWGTEGAAITRMQKPLSPADERRTMQLPPGFDALLFAAEPDVVKPIALSFDAKGRAWVLESVDYPNVKLPRAADGSPPLGHDRVKILEDTDGDGRVDATKLFAEGLNVATGLVCVDDGCIVAQAPDMLRFVDRDGDDRADERHVLFTGFGEGDTHAGPSNLRRPPPALEGAQKPGWIWATVGYSAFRGRIAGADGVLADQQFGQAVFRFREDGSALERIAPTTNNTWGLSFDEQGEIFVSTANGDHLVHVAVPSPAIESVFGLAAKGADGTVHVPDHDRLHPLAALRQVDYHGGFTAAAGCSIYTARSFPREYWNRCAFVCEPTGHLVHQCFLEADPVAPSTFVARDGRNLLSSFDEWCAPIAADVGPDGAVWVLDWYSPVVQHNPTPHGFTTGKGNAYETPHRDKVHGRIWRIVWSGGESAENGLAGPNDPELPTAAARLRQELLVTRERVAPSFAMAALETWKAARAGDDRPLALAAEIALARTWSSSLPALLAQEEEEKEAGERAGAPADGGALLVNADFAERTSGFPESWRAVGYGGIAVQRWNEGGHAVAGSAQITSPNGADASLSQTVPVKRRARYRLSGWIRTEGVKPLGEAYGALFNVHELQNPRVVTPAVTGTHDWRKVEVEFESGDHEQLTINCLLGGWGRASGTAWYDDVALELVAAGSPLAELVELVAANAAHADPVRATAAILERAAAADPDVLAAALTGATRGWPRSAPSFSLTPGASAMLRGVASRIDVDVAGRAAALLFAEKLGRLDLFPDEVARVRAELAHELADDGASSAERVDAAARALALGPAAEVVPLVAAQLSARAEPELVKGLLRALGESGAPEVGGEVAKRARELSASTFPGAVELLLRRPAWTKLLLEQLESRKLDPRSLAPDVLERLRRSDDPAIAAAAETIAAAAGRPRNADRAKVVESWLRLAAPASTGAPRGDARRGAVVFEEKCAKCHSIRGKGGAVGPELTAIGKRGRADLLVEILDPNRAVEGTYRAWEATTKTGDELTGRLVNEGRSTIEIVDATAARHVIARDDLERLRPLAVSLMPEGLEEMGEADLSALLEFLVQEATSDPKPGAGGG